MIGGLTTRRSYWHLHDCQRLDDASLPAPSTRRQGAGRHVVACAAYTTPGGWTTRRRLRRLHDVTEELVLQRSGGADAAAGLQVEQARQQIVGAVRHFAPTALLQQQSVELSFGL